MILTTQPQDIQIIVDKLSGEYAERFALLWNSIDFPGKKAAIDADVEFIHLSQPDMEKLKELRKPIEDKWVKEMAGKGYSEAEARSWIKFLRERSNYWAAKQKDWFVQVP